MKIAAHTLEEHAYNLNEFICDRSQWWVLQHSYYICYTQKKNVSSIYQADKNR